MDGGLYFYEAPLCNRISILSLIEELGTFLDN